MDITFLGTGSAWGVPEINCDCAICCEMRAQQERRDRTSILLSEADTTLLVDCEPSPKAASWEASIPHSREPGAMAGNRGSNPFGP